MLTGATRVRLRLLDHLLPDGRHRPIEVLLEEPDVPECHVFRNVDVHPEAEESVFFAPGQLEARVSERMPPEVLIHRLVALSFRVVNYRFHRHDPSYRGSRLHLSP